MIAHLFFRNPLLVTLPGDRLHFNARASEAPGGTCPIMGPLKCDVRSNSATETWLHRHGVLLDEIAPPLRRFVFEEMVCHCSARRAALLGGAYLGPNRSSLQGINPGAPKMLARWGACVRMQRFVPRQWWCTSFLDAFGGVTDEELASDWPATACRTVRAALDAQPRRRKLFHRVLAAVDHEIAAYLQPPNVQSTGHYMCPRGDTALLGRTELSAWRLAYPTEPYGAAVMARYMYKDWGLMRDHVYMEAFGADVGVDGSTAHGKAKRCCAKTMDNLAISVVLYYQDVDAGNESNYITHL
jgi:hypothetical protein